MNLKHLKSPFVILLIGPPLSGKTTFVNNFKSDVDFDLISRDQAVLDVYGSDNYDEAFKNVNQREVDTLLISSIKKASKENRNVIIDMTHMTRKRRSYNLSFFGNEYSKVAVIFPILSSEEYEKRNIKRQKEEQKFIPLHVLQNMIASYQTISDKEGFDKVISI